MRELTTSSFHANQAQPSPTKPNQAYEPYIEPKHFLQACFRFLAAEHKNINPPQSLATQPAISTVEIVWHIHVKSLLICGCGPGKNGSVEESDNPLC